ncbi:hypothetical protein RJ639_007796 [Escallonia herrerae]|uniref:Pentatricopeptide repeat-containing protein n=1 Tax=Escallonia herrerae TaxID=1293975 RepID=A0AA89AYR8_9ASTE|nr:hypothetical protein RJ639_007796 [Escallonia herrerae]
MKAFPLGYLSSRPYTARPKASTPCAAKPDSLYRRISAVGAPTDSVVPFLYQWIQEGRNVDKIELRAMIRERRIDYKCLLVILSEKKNIPQQLKDSDVYIALLNCYALVRSAEKAGNAMQKLRDRGYRKPSAYNVLMNLYYQTGSWDKMDCLMQEMDEKGIHFDVYTLTLRLSAYSAASDREGIDKILKRMESDPRIVMDCDAYVAAANGYLKLGLVEKALEITKKLEGLIPTSKKRTFTLDCLLRLYAWTGKKDELYRIWELYKKEKIFNKGYISMLSALNILDDIEGAEMIFEEWELTGLSYAFRIPNFLIAAYCRHGHLGKAEALVDKWVVKGVDPLSSTWFTLAGGYIADNQIPKAVEALKKAICPDTIMHDKDEKKRALPSRKIKVAANANIIIETKKIRKVTPSINFCRRDCLKSFNRKGDVRIERKVITNVKANMRERAPEVDPRTHRLKKPASHVPVRSAPVLPIFDALAPGPPLAPAPAPGPSLVLAPALGPSLAPAPALGPGGPHHHFVTCCRI